MRNLCATFLGYDCESLFEEKETAEYLSRNKLIPDSTPKALCYFGHQYGIFAVQLRDERAITLYDFYDID